MTSPLQPRPLPRHLFPLLALMLAACAPAPIYRPTAATVAATPAQVSQAPDRYQGADVIWGGRVVGVTNLADHSEIELLALPLDRSQRPRPGDRAGNRFIATVPGYVESLDFPPGTLMTVTGRVTGTRRGSVGKAPYLFPVVAARASHVWTAREMESGRVRFGVGVGVGLH